MNKKTETPKAKRPPPPMQAIIDEFDPSRVNGEDQQQEPVWGPDPPPNDGDEQQQYERGEAKPGERGGGLPFVLFDQIELVAKEWLAENFLGVGETSCWYGEPGSGKSVLVEDFGLHVAARMKWLDRDVKQGAVLYIALERTQLVKRRALAFKIKYNASGLPFAVMGGVLDFRNPKVVNAVLQTVVELERVTKQKTVLIILDTISRALCGGDENSPKDMGALVNAISRIQEATSAHIALVHHVPHEADRMRGHGSLLGAIDTGVHVIKGAGTRAGIVVKTNDGDEGARVNFKLESVELCADEKSTTSAPVVVPLEGIEAVAAGVGSRKKLNDNQQRFLDILRFAINDAPANPRDVPKAAGGAPAVKRGILKSQLLQRGWMEEAESARGRAKLSDMLNGLAGRRLIGLTAEFVWVM
jgi:hypothetical protein